MSVTPELDRWMPCVVLALVLALAIADSALERGRVSRAIEAGYTIGQGVGMCAVADMLHDKPPSPELLRLCAKARAAATSFHLKVPDGKPT